MLNAMVLPVLVLVLAPPMIHHHLDIFLDCYSQPLKRLAKRVRGEGEGEVPLLVNSGRDLNCAQYGLIASHTIGPNIDL